MHLSRRTFLALSATVIAACSGDETSTDSTASPTTGPPPTDPPPTDPPPTDPPATSTTTSTTTTTTPAVQLDADPFTLGVSSGDPDRSSVVLWTRLTGELPADGIDVDWEVTSDDGTVLASGTARTDADLGGSVHAVASLDAPGTFVFRAGGFESPAGRTAPVTGAAEYRFASASCQNYEGGFYAAHRDIAEWAPDLVVFLGDFIYEGDAGDDGVRAHEGPEPTDLDGYRRRWATYLSDPQLQSARAACPWLVIWDDHEVENNYAGLVSQDDADPTEFARRRNEAYRAWWEHTPTRLPAPGAPDDDYPIYRGVDVGDLLRLSALDGRQYRSDQVCEATFDLGPPCDGADDPARTMLGAAQEAWLADRFASSTAAWNGVAQQTVMSDLRVPGTEGILNYDQWDGYWPARDRLLGAAPADLVVVTGDIHLAGVGQLTDPAGAPVGAEFVTTAISSTANVPVDFAPAVAALENIVDAELVFRGYTRHTVTADAWTAEYRTVDDVTDADSPVSTWKTFRVDRGDPTPRPV